MPLPAPNLDDRKFQDIVDETKRLIPQFCPEWTNHNLNDPGVALIELFAWMSEMILFRLNQVPDRLYIKFLDLVGIQPFPPSVARTDLTFWLSTVLDRDVVVPAGTEIATQAGVGPAVVFSTNEDLIMSPPDLVAARTGTAGESLRYEDVWDDLRFGEPAVVCFRSEPPRPGDSLNFGFSTSLAGSLLRLRLKASVEGVGVDPNDPPVAWKVWAETSWRDCTVYRDATGGLNRDGDVELLIPSVMSPLTLGDHSAFWLRAELQEPRTDQPGYQRSPRVTAVTAETLGGTVAAEHAAVVERESLGRSTGTPGQEFVLAHAPVVPRTAEEHIRVISVESATDWVEVHDFSQSGPADPHYTLDGATGTVTFGPRVRYPDADLPRQHGAIPPDGAEILMARHRYGGGVAGNVAGNTLTVFQHNLAYVSAVTNLQPAFGGVDPEAPANAKLRGPLSLRTSNRAVTVSDFERLTYEASTEVANARCLAPKTPSDPIRVLVVPRRDDIPADKQVIDDFALSEDLVRRVKDYLEPRRLLGSTVSIGTPYYQGVTVAALVQAASGRPPELVRQRALELLYHFVNPLVGGASGAGWPFDVNISAGPIAQMLEAIEGVARVEEVLLFEYDLRNRHRGEEGREMIRLEPNSLFLSARHQVVVRSAI